jgi:quinoprotein glucose dehydrogenase
MTSKLRCHFKILGIGGPIVTPSGLAVITGAMDDYLRAFNIETGEELQNKTGGNWALANNTRGKYAIEFKDGSRREYVLISAGDNGAGPMLPPQNVVN